MPWSAGGAVVLGAEGGGCRWCMVQLGWGVTEQRPPPNHPGPLTQREVLETHGGSTVHTRAWAMGGSASPLCCSVGHSRSQPHTLTGRGGQAAQAFCQAWERGEPLPVSGGGWGETWMGDGFMSETFSQEFVTTYKHLFFSPPFFFFPLTATRPEGCVCAGAMGKWGLGFIFLLRFLGKNYLVLIPLLQSLVSGKKLLPAAGKAGQERDCISPSIAHPRLDPVLGTPKHPWALEAA